MKFRFALLIAALTLALSISAFAYSEESPQENAAPAQDKTATDESSSPLSLIHISEPTRLRRIYTRSLVGSVRCV